MTQCNAGALATAGIGTALGVIRVAVEQGRRLRVFVPETRPYLQGARLTAWELAEGGIPLTLITDNMVGHFLKTGNVGAVVVGADRIAANGDTANKIGTYAMAVLARENGVPFYVAAPVSPLDLSIAGGDEIPIEERAAEEVTHLRGVRIAPDVDVANPAFDVTPARLIAAIITERGVARAPYVDFLGRAAGRRCASSFLASGLSSSSRLQVWFAPAHFAGAPHWDRWFSRFSQLDGRTEALVILVAHRHPYAHVPGLEMQIVVGMRIGGKPEAALDILAIGNKTRKQVFLDVGHGLAVALDNR